MKNLLKEFFNSKSGVSILEASEQERLEKDFQEWYNEKMKDFGFAVEPAIRYLLQNQFTHTKIYIDYDTAELLYGQKNHNLANEVPD